MDILWIDTRELAFSFVLGRLFLICSTESTYNCDQRLFISDEILLAIGCHAGYAPDAGVVMSPAIRMESSHPGAQAQ